MTTTTKKASPPKDEIRAGERRELKALVKAKIKVMREEADQICADELARVETAIAEQFKADDERVTQLDKRLGELIRDTNTMIDVLYREFSDVVSPSHRPHVSTPFYSKRDRGRMEARRALMAQAQAKQCRAQQELTKLEVQLIEELTLDGLKTDAAKQFVRTMPDIFAVLENATRVAIGSDSHGY